MKYLDGKEIRVGDRVEIDGGDHGTVVVCIESNTSIADYDASDWAYLEKGVMVLTDAKALVRVSRAANSRGSLMIARADD